jgi:hypothetical protein
VRCGCISEFPLSLRLVEEMLLERGIVVSYETIRRWAIKFGPDYARRLRRKSPSCGDIWHLDEVVITIRVAVARRRSGRICPRRNRSSPSRYKGEASQNQNESTQFRLQTSQFSKSRSAPEVAMRRRPNGCNTHLIRAFRRLSKNRRKSLAAPCVLRRQLQGLRINVIALIPRQR